MGDSTDGSRRERMAVLGRYAGPGPGDRGYAAHQRRFAALDADPKHRKAMKALHEKSIATLLAQRSSGAGYEADKTLRCFLLEYNNRLFSHGRDSFPSSFDICEAFFATRKEFAGLFLLPERDYLVSFTDFLDFATAGDAPSADIEKAQNLPEGVIVNVTSLDLPGELLLETDATSSFGFIAASMVRRGDELALLVVLGEQRPAEDTAARESEMATPEWLNPNKPFLTDSSPPASTAAVRVAGTDLQRTLALARFNLKERRLESRQLMREHENAFDVLTDTEGMYTELSLEARNKMMQGAREKLDTVSSVWEVAKTLVLLPAYLAARVDVVKTEDRPTALGTNLRNSHKARREVEAAAQEAKVLHRRISAVRVIRTTPLLLQGRAYRAPAFQVPVEGFWRRFADPARQGHDETGEPVTGKTWVRAHLRHKDKAAPLEPKVVYVKASLSLARQQLERYRRKTEGKQGRAPAPAAAAVPPAGPVEDLAASAPVPEVVRAQPVDREVPATGLPGAFLYVMRCPAHGRDIFKVGYTDRDPEVRARELSAATASPTHFLLVQAWAVSEGLQAERAAHEQLSAYRLSTNREFFQAPYSQLRQHIESAIGPWSLD